MPDKKLTDNEIRNIKKRLKETKQLSDKGE